MEKLASAHRGDAQGKALGISVSLKHQMESIQSVTLCDRPDEAATRGVKPGLALSMHLDVMHGGKRGKDEGIGSITRVIESFIPVVQQTTAQYQSSGP